MSAWPAPGLPAARIASARHQAEVDVGAGQDLVVGIQRCLGHRRRRLGYAVVEHVDDRAANLLIAQVGQAAAGRHRTVAMDRRRHQRVQALLQPRDPGLPITDLRRAFLSGLVALRALVLHDRLAGAQHGRRATADRLDPVATRLVDHVDDRTFDLDVADAGVAAMRRHVADALDRMLGQGAEPLRRARRPGLRVADLRRLVLARHVAGATHRVDDFLAEPLLALRVGGQAEYGERDDQCGWLGHRACLRPDRAGMTIDSS